MAAARADGRLEAAVALLPVAAIEGHGPHLPLATDALILAAVIEAARTRLPPAPVVLCLPLQAVGLSPEHAAFPGTLSLPVETARTAWEALGRGAAAAGIRRLLIVNSHGGNPALCDLVIQSLRAADRMLAARTDVFRLWQADGALPAGELRWGVHGGAVETAVMRAIHPELVDETAVAAFPNARARRAEHAPGFTAGLGRVAWQSEDLNPAGAVGDSRLGDAALGRALCDGAADRLVALIAELAAWPLP